MLPSESYGLISAASCRDRVVRTADSGTLRTPEDLRAFDPMTPDVRRHIVGPVTRSARPGPGLTDPVVGHGHCERASREEAMADDGFAVALYREGGNWQCDLLPPAVMDSLASCAAVLRQQPPEGGPIALVDVDDEFFVALRLAPGGGLRLLLSDATAAAEWDLARQVLGRLGEPEPVGEDLEEPWPAGDLDLFADLGLPERDLRTILDDEDLYADEMLAAITRQIGVGAAYTRVVDSLTG